MKMKKAVLLLTALALILGFGGPAAADYIYVQSLTSYQDENASWPLTTWTGNAASLEEAIIGAPDYDPVNGTGDVLGWQQGYGNFVLDFGSLLSGELDITFWHFGGIKGGVAKELISFSVSEDGANWSSSVLLEDVLAGGETLFETTYDLFDTFGVNALRYLKVEKTSGGAGTGKFIDAVGVSAVPVPGAVWLMGSGLLGLIGLRRKKV
ncbi:PEP-CTERM sorting domain-containing protein [uncultured Desulfosarcina sp.]|uniref:PEP-CTERM sorting domain-containing protein n=1 Tax=uncultured Desulfosarcina sp. TaxID=218289 RepID=UPI0029C9639C|nr:PEP-CTERM sorting domain-containing protein [uncultured Desulfosarcina sp.]